MSRILVIDDDSSIRIMLRQALEKGGHEVTVAEDGQKGLAAQKQAPAELVITDLIMPGMEGIETIMELRKRSPNLKIIAMSGGGVGKGADYLTMARKFGAARTINKPFSLGTLLQAVNEVLAESPGQGGPTPPA
ncbi:MAG TPA: response regulator [Lacunisphaera sp.]|nr:response regulator [Lacunisphaera sp.]